MTPNRMMRAVSVVAVLGALGAACSSAAPADEENAQSGKGALSGTAGTCTTGSATDTVTLVDVAIDTGLIDGLRIVPSPPGGAFGIYKHESFTRHLPSRQIPGKPVIPGNPVRPQCTGLAHSWDAHVKSGVINQRTFLVILANMARASCSAEITVDCTTSNALLIQPLTE